MLLSEVLSKDQEKTFIDFPKVHYKGDPHFVCPLDLDMKAIFDPSKNVNFMHGEAIRWLLYNEHKELIGRIAAFVDQKKLTHYKVPCGGCGFFECIDNQEAANMLFNAAKTWLSKRGVKAMQGPINFGENFNHWGLLADGFVQQGYGMPYNYPYYKVLFENYGFKNYFEQYSYHKLLAEGWPEKLYKLAALTSQRAGYTFKHFSYKKLDLFVDYFAEIYNEIWSVYQENYTQLNKPEVRSLFLESKSIIDEEMIWFAFDKGKPVGVLLSIPDMNQVLKKLKNGRLNFINRLKFLYFKSRLITRNRALLAGIHPNYQNSGIALALFYQLAEALRRKPEQREMELSWVGDFNPKMIGIYDKIGAIRHKTHITYLYLFDSNTTFERFTNEFEGKRY